MCDWIGGIRSKKQLEEAATEVQRTTQAHYVSRCGGAKKSQPHGRTMCRDVVEDDSDEDHTGALCVAVR